MADSGAVLLDHRISARRPRALLAIAAFWVCAGGLWVAGVIWWVPAFLCCVTIPALLEALRNDVVRLTLSRDVLSWVTTRHRGKVPLTEVAYVRFDTRMDFAVTARLHLVGGTVQRLPIEVVPPYRQFCDALDVAGVRHERHHFRLF
ncbi:hypothetical protein [Marivita sp. XM-24bin2]|jgi:hypothetical protein|uniref:hypothetical protein n=1 Tax=unclassified Marivita TaxID=2632480 RepID=UPI000D79DF2F|nr:hypothetical protein [Marivita sp. XM-24bin2]MCR9109820.1 hypothetical protein [Paracoccaceae bacterium]PWL36642.1 MAG: hypothetical protein DCO97_02410 [Marivita sp. XM-24bin2]